MSPQEKANARTLAAKRCFDAAQIHVHPTRHPTNQQLALIEQVLKDYASDCVANAIFDLREREANEMEYESGKHYSHAAAPFQRLP